jgi:leucyl aminopeptidase
MSAACRHGSRCPRERTSSTPDASPQRIGWRWGPERAPRVTLVGKGVCFDTGGLDLKPSQAMALMKKDMGGAAIALGLARLIMDAGLELRLRLLIPAVENNISANAYRPGDVLATRKGLTVEVGNTDAEGRLVLADALALACEESPELLIDLATLTGAARVALGPKLPALYTQDETLATDLELWARAEQDPCWQACLRTRPTWRSCTVIPSPASRQSRCWARCSAWHSQSSCSATCWTGG